MLGANHGQFLLHMSRILVYTYTTEKLISQFAIGYMVNPTIHVNKVFREQVEKFLRSTFHQNIMEGIKSVTIKNYIYIISLIMFYNTKNKQPNRIL